MSSQPPWNSIDSLSPTPMSPYGSNEFPFSSVDSPRSPNVSARYYPRRESTMSSTTSIGGALDSASNNWSHDAADGGQNAISTLLQPPIVRTGLLPHSAAPASSAHRPPTSKDIPPVTLSNIAHVDPVEFKPYLAQVGSLYDALQRVKENEDDGGVRLLRRGPKVDEFADLLDNGHKKAVGRPSFWRQASLASLASLSPTEQPQPRKRSPLGSGRRAAQAMTPLSTIPNVYFDDDFHLENPRIFDVVSERSEVVRPVPSTPVEGQNSNGNIPGPRKALATNAILQEKLSWYMDTIEVHLISSISSASTSFFAALGSLRDLHSEAAESVARIKILREELDALDKDIAVGGLDIVSKRRKRENLKQLGDVVKQLKCIVDGVGYCESLVDKGSVEVALNAMDALERLIAGEQSNADAKVLEIDRQRNLQDLKGVTALRGVSDDLDTLRIRIGKNFEGKFLEALLGDLRRHIETTPANETLQRWGIASQRSRGGHSREPSAYPTYLTISNEFRSQLLSNLNGLHRAQHTSPATSAYRDAVLKEIKRIIKGPLPSSNDEDNDSMMSVSTVGGKQLTQQERSAVLARNLRALEPEAAEETLVKIYVGVGETLRRLGTQVKVLLDVTFSFDDLSPGMGPKSPLRSPNIAAVDDRRRSFDNRQSSSLKLQEEIHQALDVSNLLGQAVDIAQTQIVKILRVRTEQSTHQSLTRFLRYFTLNLLFANECEAVSGRSGTALKNLVNSQIKDFIKQLGDRQQQNLAQGMDSDQWNAKDFDESDSVHLTRILEGSNRDPEAWTVGGKIWLPYEAYEDIDPHFASRNSQSLSNGTAAKDKARSATIDSESFILPASAILCLRGLEPYLQLITGIPSLTSEIAPLLLSYLQLFNSRCTQLILGAGATKSVGLKNITTKHLALASQALSFIATLIPHVREFVRRHAGSGPAVSSLMGDFDKVKRLYQEHQVSISDKLVNIMSGRASLHVKSMKAINWDSSSSSAVSPYMETLTKETTTLQKVLSRHLPDLTVMMIMDPVFKSYKDQWGKAFGDVVVETEGGKERILRDAEYFQSRLGKIDGAADVGEYLVKLVRDKKILKPEPVVPPIAAEPEPEPKPEITTPAAEVNSSEANGTTENRQEDKPTPVLPSIGDDNEIPPVGDDV